MDKLDTKYDVEYAFTVKRINDRSSFHGLWELSIVDKDGNEETLIDADMLSNVVAKLGQVLENDGY